MTCSHSHSSSETRVGNKLVKILTINSFSTGTHFYHEFWL
ncbi:hypothetical protein E2C01_096614 [Portunus trituberculatus]|uniref:Uncharacterized protein n=1 Tax=Portunus trituberculatus TaxID=210409 RepID=A0A5B7JT06_PORTR|nr:hypothetical protein [Portunus trituberculatus]